MTIGNTATGEGTEPTVTADHERRELWNGFGEGLARAFELAVTPAVFGVVGYAIDRWLGLVPAFTIALLVLSLVGMFVRLWYAYDAEMRAHETKQGWAPGRIGTQPAAGERHR